MFSTSYGLWGKSQIPGVWQVSAIHWMKFEETPGIVTTRLHITLLTKQGCLNVYA
jgi:hypothetical protein